MAVNDTRRVTVEFELLEDMDDPTEVPWNENAVRRLMYQAFAALDKEDKSHPSLSRVGRIVFPDGEHDDPTHDC